jgi:hypothetical protein
MKKVIDCGAGRLYKKLLTVVLAGYENTKWICP